MRKKISIISILVMLSLLTTSMTFSYWASHILGDSKITNNNINVGDWVPDGYQPIYEEDDFIKLVETHTKETKIILMNDVVIDISEPLQPFNGTIDGNGYTITNTGTITTPVTTGTNVYVGLFERINEGAVIKNLILDGIHINASSSASYNTYAAVLAAYNAGIVENVVVRNSSVTFVHEIGTQGGELHIHVSGLVGENGPNGNAIVRNSYSEATVTGTIRKTNNGTRLINLYVGGLVGKNVSGQVINSYATGNITGYGYNTATTSNDNRRTIVYAGGLVGYNDNYNGGTARVTSSFATGNIRVERIGTANGRVHLYAGRLVGNNSGTITNSYYLSTQTLSVATSSSNPTRVTHYNNGTSATAAQLRDLNRNGLSSWDTTDIWITHTNRYPTLRMEE